MTYKDLGKALKEGDRVELSKINQHGKAVEWNKVHKINTLFNINRYRIVKNDNTIIDGLDKP